ncbi:MAG: ATP-binding protein [Mariprofundales bacterium]|nr:ATP-binding protein [Mariprofundales bacterium]
MQQIDMERIELADIHLQIRRACHDLNAPLRAARGFADILRQREAANLSERGALYLQRMVAVTEQMAQVVDGLHHYARLSTYHCIVEELAIVPSLQRHLATLYPQEIAVGQLRCVGEAELLWVADKRLIQVAVGELVANGLRFHNEQQLPQVLVSFVVVDGALNITVTDNGIGIAEEYQQQIFNLFERLHNREHYSGAGVGLTLVLKAVQLLRGTIAMESAEGEGAVVTITLPQLTVGGA